MNSSAAATQADSTDDASRADVPAYEFDVPTELTLIDDESGQVDDWGIPWRHVSSRGPEYEAAKRAVLERGDFGPLRAWVESEGSEHDEQEARETMALRSRARVLPDGRPDPRPLERRPSQHELHLAAALSAHSAHPADRAPNAEVSNDRG